MSLFNQSEHRQNLLTLFNEKTTIAGFYGLRLSFSSQDRAIIHLPYPPKEDLALGWVQGEIYAVMLDNAGWFTVAASQTKHCWIATSEISIHLFQPFKARSLQARGEVMAIQKNIWTAEMRLTDEEGRLAGEGKGTYLIQPKLVLIK